ncbi:putative ribonuclease H-like domain-containing protein, partial [Tanacetum coccineum]
MVKLHIGMYRKPIIFSFGGNTTRAKGLQLILSNVLEVIFEPFSEMTVGGWLACVGLSLYYTSPAMHSSLAVYYEVCLSDTWWYQLQRPLMNNVEVVFPDDDGEYLIDDCDLLANCRVQITERLPYNPIRSSLRPHLKTSRVVGGVGNCRYLQIWWGSVVVSKSSSQYHFTRRALVEGHWSSWVSDDEEEVESIPKEEKKAFVPIATEKKSLKPASPSRKSIRYAEMYRSQRPRGNQRSWNGQKSHQLGVNFVFNNKACFICGNFDHFQYDCPNAYKHMIPRAVLMRTGLKTVKNAKPLSTARSVNTVRPASTARHMSGNIAHLSDFKEFDGGFVTFGGGANGGRITGKGTIKTDKLDFEDVYFVKELKFNLFSVSQMCDKKNYVLFTDSECLVLSPNFKLPDESQVLLKIPRQNNMYSFDMNQTCLRMRMTNLVRDLPLKRFENDQTCVACLKGKQHRASYKTKVFNPVTKPLFMLHMDLFGPTFVSSLMHKKYCLVVTYDYSRFSWVFFLTTKDETSEILKNFIKEAARTMLADSKLPTTFWAEAVSTACYVHNRVLIVKPHNKTPYELFR